jgi:Fe-Mn family superoxide dismutase
MLNTAVRELTFPKLPYGYDALEPYIDAQTMEIHYSKHHKAYYDKFMAAIKESPFQQMSLTELFGQISKAPAGVRNNGGGFYNHDLFWNVMGKNLTATESQAHNDLMKAIRSSFGSMDNFKAEFSDAAANRFGSGWAWLVVDGTGALKITSTPNQDNPLMDVAEVRGMPILGLDVWEHAYYLKYQNRRPEYIKNWFNVVNWEAVAKNFKNVKW